MIIIDKKEIKKYLKEYLDILEEIKKTESKIKRIEKREVNASDSVTGSSQNFPFVETHFKIYGKDMQRAELLDKYLNLLEERKNRLLEIKIKVEEFINSIDTSRMRRIFEYKYLDNYTWNKIAELLGNGACSESIRKEHDRFFQKK